MKFLVAGLCLLLAADAARAQDQAQTQDQGPDKARIVLQPGQWRVMTTQLGSKGPAAAPEVKMRCLTPADVADVRKTFSPAVSTVNADCEPTEYSYEQNFMKWRLQCRGQIDMDVGGQFIFESPTRYTAMVVTRAELMGKVVQSTMSTIDGERVGACP